MIVCRICQQEFQNMISWKHLKKHNTTVKEYKEEYGDVVTPEYRQLKQQQNAGKHNPNYGNHLSKESKDRISKANKRKTPHNKNKKMSEDQKSILSKKAKERNALWQENNNHPLFGRKHSEETREKIKQKRANQIITKEQVQKALETKRLRGYDLAIFRGKTHSDQTKKKISEAAKKTNKIKTENSIKEAEIRLENFGYNLCNTSSNLFSIECKSCGTTFTRTRQYATPSKINAKMCPSCYPPVTGTSIYEKEIYDFLKFYTNVETNNRSVIAPKEIDLLLPDKKIGIEFNGLYWHSDKYKNSDYHVQKKKDANSNNLDLIHIFEDEWINQKDIVKSRLLSWINFSPEVIYARKCDLKEIDSKTANQFLRENHIQGSGRSNVRVGLYYKKSLVSVMTFLNNDISKNVNGWELNRFCSKKFTQIVGSASKMFKYFLKTYNPETITSFCDLRWNKRKTVYEKLGFEFKHNSSPNYWYFLPAEGIRYHRYSLRKPANSKLTERELRDSQGYLRIYDCGSSKWVWTK